MNYYVGVDIGGSKIAIAVCDESYNIICKDKIPNNITIPYENVIKSLADGIVSLVNEASISMDDVKSIGVSMAGVIDIQTKTMVLTPNLDWGGKNIPNDLGKYINKPIIMGNDADCAILGEYKAGVKLENFTMITLGTGVGGGLILNGELYLDRNSEGLELGHVTLVAGGRKCGCGNLGCLETYCSTKALIAQTKESVTEQSVLFKKAQDNTLTGLDIFEAAKSGDDEAKKSLETYVSYLADACYSLIMSHRTEALVIGGGTSQNDEFLIEPLKKLVYEKLSPFGKIKDTKVLKAVLGNDAGLVGAAALKE